MVNGAIEKMRAAGEVKSSLQAHPVLHAPDAVIEAFSGLDAAEIFITSSAELVAGAPPADAVTDEDGHIGVVVGLADGGKCQRCWKILPEVDADADDAICGRCASVVSTMDAA